MSHSNVIVFFISLFASVAIATAADIVIEDARWVELSPDQQSEIIKRLKTTGAIGADDQVIYKPPKDNEISEKDFNPLATGAAIAATICRAKNLLNRSDCTKLSNPDERKSCQAAEKTRFDSLKSGCER